MSKFIELKTALTFAEARKSEVQFAVAQLHEITDKFHDWAHIAVLDSSDPNVLPVQAVRFAVTAVDVAPISVRSKQVLLAFRQWRAALDRVRSIYDSLHAAEKVESAQHFPEIQNDRTVLG